jgi:hypothetical protein
VCCGAKARNVNKIAGTRLTPLFEKGAVRRVEGLARGEHINPLREFIQGSAIFSGSHKSSGCTATFPHLLHVYLVLCTLF